MARQENIHTELLRPPIRPAVGDFPQGFLLLGYHLDLAWISVVIMSSLTREVAFGVTASFKSEADFLAPQRAPPPRPTLGRASASGGATGFAISSSRAAAAAGLQRQAEADGQPESLPQAAAPVGDVEEAHQPLLAQPTASIVAPLGGGPRAVVAVDDFSRRVRLGINASWAVNISLLVAKIVAFAVSQSYSVLASAVDSLVDLLSQGLLAVAEHHAATFDPRFPIGAGAGGLLAACVRACMRAWGRCIRVALVLHAHHMAYQCAEHDEACHVRARWTHVAPTWTGRCRRCCADGKSC